MSQIVSRAPSARGMLSVSRMRRRKAARTQPMCEMGHPFPWRTDAKGEMCHQSAQRSEPTNELRHATRDCCHPPFDWSHPTVDWSLPRKHGREPMGERRHQLVGWTQPMSERRHQSADWREPMHEMRLPLAATREPECATTHPMSGIAQPITDARPVHRAYTARRSKCTLPTSFRSTWYRSNSRCSSSDALMSTPRTVMVPLGPAPANMSCA